MSKLLEHAEQELKYAGYHIDNDNRTYKDPMDGYGDGCAKCALEMLKVFEKQGHSGMSANITLNIFNRLARFENLTELTNNPDEWQKLGGDNDKDWQSKRNCSCFSSDLKTYWNIEEKENKIIDEDGWFTMKPKSEWVKHKLKDYKEGK